LNNAFGQNAEAGELDPGTNMDLDSNVNGAGAAMDVDKLKGAETTNEGAEEIMMSTLRNKNKKRGFKQSMAAPLPKKIVFDDAPGEGVVVSNEECITAPPEESVQVPPPYVRLVPPSEKQDLGQLPPRMFVTSVDVEEGMWGVKGKKQKKKQKVWEEEVWYEEEAEVEDVVLEYGEDEANGECVDWGRVENGWEAFQALTSPEQLQLGGLIGWKVCLFI
jgi:hypothetical protein